MHALQPVRTHLYNPYEHTHIHAYARENVHTLGPTHADGARISKTSLPPCADTHIGTYACAHMLMHTHIRLGMMHAHVHEPSRRGAHEHARSPSQKHARTSMHTHTRMRTYAYARPRIQDPYVHTRTQTYFTPIRIHAYNPYEHTHIDAYTLTRVGMRLRSDVHTKRLGAQADSNFAHALTHI